MSTLSKRELIDQSIENIFKLLIEVGSSPGNYVEAKHILTALKSQGGVCSLDIEFSIGNEQLIIRPISLNTLKNRLTESGLDRDFYHLDKLRIHALDATKSLGKVLAPPKKRSLSALEDQVEELKGSIATLHAVNMVLVQALEVNRRDLITIADTPGTGLRQKRIDDAINRVIKILGLNPAPFDDVTVLSMKNHLHLVHDDKANR
ncbi:hypothetical protein [Pseudomonas gingeri]|uniref:hypothetical protein n=1 Tax=Pseudomonas gingeri TaxID=117681 RepID=UPI0015A1F787|nr:hypothetical protein [Pseudomonas gingeri]NWD04955.1 hypothetical protein [Pseudomonas gingeri]NWE31279.1 hypothetical protein [Pseudomonas gingeri]NWE56731.1 hypothetical protein [Pseudomonas gingeri]NWF05433.1 hypothetical protein [Pseudomonas gingeri]